MKIERVTAGMSIKRSVDAGTEDQQRTVRAIIEDVKENGDRALFDYTEKFDGAKLYSLKVTQEEINEAYEALDDEMIKVIREAADNIAAFHAKQKRETWLYTNEDGSILGQKMTPLDSAGVYVPGGTAAYPSSVLMNVMPAKIAGVERIVMVSPPGNDGRLPAGVLVAADIAGVKDIFKVGGAQAVAALAYGTESIKAVDKITGPGNIFVALAKREVFGDVDIDMIAGPSEIAVLADDTASAKEVAADMLSQAEHDRRASAVLVTTSQELAQAVARKIEDQLMSLPRSEIARASIDDYGAIYVAGSMKEAVQTINELAPEHLEIITENALELVKDIKHAGAIFVGRYSSEPVGDYFAGPNHVLPTNGTARFAGPLSVDDFMKKSSIIMYSKQAFDKHGKKIAAFARLEGLEAHARAIEARND
ncbi:histidinol dehydrogenase [Domibacillus antri]|uniref:Histidinol dehydrogenase n=1 Tax=Domibacillus antri TaxID=1714264 RepID=A0A1Q8QA98_9BACI|nr:histidinol dehydrogenase [Domibacillus antri]OLN24231.1 histidinol dehydrogenase [Domibacillus antri]